MSHTFCFLKFNNQDTTQYIEDRHRKGKYTLDVDKLYSSTRLDTLDTPFILNDKRE